MSMDGEVSQRKKSMMMADILRLSSFLALMSIRMKLQQLTRGLNKLLP
jgi:hypothetical protein